MGQRNNKSDGPHAASRKVYISLTTERTQESVRRSIPFVFVALLIAKVISCVPERNDGGEKKQTNKDFRHAEIIAGKSLARNATNKQPAVILILLAAFSPSLTLVLPSHYGRLAPDN
jgi:hypothetical protein